MMTLELLKQLAKALAVQFGNDCEVVIHDLTRKSLHKSIVYIENGHITNRKTGDGPSKVVLETMRKDPSKISDHLGYLTKTNDGKTLKSSTISFVKKKVDQSSISLPSILTLPISCISGFCPLTHQ